MDALELKEYIIEHDCVKGILESLECHSIRSYANEFRAGLPNGHNSTNISIKKDTLHVRIYAKDKQVKGDIITLVMHIQSSTFYNALKYIHKTLGLSFSLKAKDLKDKKPDPLAIFKRIKKRYGDNEIELQHYDLNILNNYVNLPNVFFLREGISAYTQNKYKIGFCPDNNRITIPHFYWCSDSDDIIGVMGRTIIPDYKILDIPKYFPLKAFPKSQNIYGLSHNYKEIQHAGMVVVFESEKSTMKMDSLQKQYSVSIGGHDISREQWKILIGLDVEIIIAFDTDISDEFIKEEIKNYKHIRQISYIKDKYNILGDKMSPIDGGKKKFDYLLKNKVIL